MADLKTVSSTEFQNNVGRLMDEVHKGPIAIEKYARPAVVLMRVEEYERLKAHDPMEARRAKLAAIAEEDHEQFAALYQELAK